MFHLHFNEQNQTFTIIESGATITEAYDGVNVKSSESAHFLQGLAQAISMISIIEKREFSLPDLSAIFDPAFNVLLNMAD